MIEPGQNPQYSVRNTAQPKQGAWRVYRRLLGYAFQFKFRLAVSLLFALVIAASFTTIIMSIGAALNITFGDQEDVLERYATQVERQPLLSLFPGSPEARGETTREFIRGMQQDPMRTFQALSLIIVVLALLGGVARFLQEYFAGSIGANISVQLGEEMYANVIRLPVGFFERQQSGEILARFTNDIFMVNRGLSSVFVKLMREPLKALFFLCLALSKSPGLTLIGLCALPPVAYLILYLGKKFKRSVTRSLRKIAALATVAKETFAGIVIIKGFSMESYVIERTRRELHSLRRHLLKMVRVDAMVGPLVEMTLVLGLVLFVLYSVRLVLQQQMPFGDMMALYLALAGMLDPVRKLASVNNMIQTSVASAERVFEFIDAEPSITEAADAEPIAPLHGALRFENVSFAYDGGPLVLRDIDLDIRKGDMVALVGFSGAGKSTLVKLIPRFYDVSAGRVTIDGVDIRRATFDSLRGQIGIVTQETFLFNATVAENIAFGQACPRDRVIAAAKAAHAHSFIESLPQGYDTLLGEGGAGLSGGQQQRLAIARAIIKDPAILILDEAMSNLDSESEDAIQRALDRFVLGRTTIVIAHRLSTVRRADRIVVLDEGRIAEQGPHAELLARGGIYARLHHTQFAATEAPAAPLEEVR